MVVEGKIWRLKSNFNVNSVPGHQVINLLIYITSRVFSVQPNKLRLSHSRFCGTTKINGLLFHRGTFLLILMKSIGNKRTDLTKIKGIVSIFCNLYNTYKLELQKKDDFSLGGQILKLLVVKKFFNITQVDVNLQFFD